MGTSYKASLGFGIKIEDEELIYQLNNELDVVPEHLQTIWAGDAYSDEMITFIYVKESIHYSYVYDEHESAINPNKLIVQDKWVSAITNWCKEVNIVEPQIGWWLCSSIS